MTVFRSITLPFQASLINITLDLWIARAKAKYTVITVCFKILKEVTEESLLLELELQPLFKTAPSAGIVLLKMEE